jgi:tungstate transport system permease protein
MGGHLARAFSLIFSGDLEVFSIAGTTLQLALTSTLLATLMGIPLGIFLGFSRFPGKKGLKVVFNSLMGIPTVVVGLFVYSLISRQGPLGAWGLLFTRWGIILGQTILILPVITTIIWTTLDGVDPHLVETLGTYNLSPLRRHLLILREVKKHIFLGIVTGFGRVVGEVGISMMLGGNIRWYTRTITTAISLETSKGQFEQGLALGVILLILSLGVNILLNLSLMGERE